MCDSKIQSLPHTVTDQYKAFCNKDISYSQMERKEYDAMLKRFIKYGLHRPKQRKDAIFKANLPEDESLRRRRVYMKVWRAQHPGYNRKHQENWKKRQVAVEA
jgi:hypothetical protein